MFYTGDRCRIQVTFFFYLLYFSQVIIITNIQQQLTAELIKFLFFK